MDLDQIMKRLDWLDEERRKDKNVIAALQERLQAYEGGIELANQQVKALSAELTRLTTTLTRLDQYDEALLQIRIEHKRRSEELEKQYRKSLEEAEKVRRVEMRALEADIGEVRKGLEPIPELRRGIQARQEVELRIDREIEELRLKLDETRRTTEEHGRNYRLADEGRRQDSKRLTEMQGEMAAVRKRSDEQRAQQELLGNNLRKVEARLTEVTTLETERREAQQEFLEQQTLRQVERDRAWKEVAARFEIIEKQAGEVTNQLQMMEGTHQLVRRSQESLGTLAERVERRINEITEIQRLAEERFRQEWVTFKADDQKRWSNYTLSQDEQRSESLRQYDKLLDQTAALEDQLQEVQDILRQSNEQTEKRLQSLLALAHDWVAAYERAIGQGR